jgi:hypothetical protein
MSRSNAVAVRQEAQITPIPRHDAGAVMEQVIVKGDLSLLAPEERAHYYMAVCQSVGLNPLTRPFLYVKFADGGLQLYPRKEAADQLRGIHKIQTRIVDQRVQEGIYLVVVEARHPDGRVETDIGAVPVAGLQALFLANAMKKAITQGKRRATLAMLGLSLIDDDEIRAIKGARFVEADPETGEILDAPDAPVIEVPGTDAASPAPPTGNAERVEAMTLLNAAVRQAFGQVDDAKQIRDDLVCDRFGYGQIKEASAADLRHVAEGVARWAPIDAPALLATMRMIGGAETETMAIDVAAHIADNGPDDPLIHAAMNDVLARFEARSEAVDAAIGGVIDASMAP